MPYLVSSLCHPADGYLRLTPNLEGRYGASPLWEQRLGDWRIESFAARPPSNASVHAAQVIITRDGDNIVFEDVSRVPFLPANDSNVSVRRVLDALTSTASAAMLARMSTI